MRERLFRGKRVDNGKWVEGYLGVFKGIPQIFVPFTAEQEKENEGHIFSAVGGIWYTVIPETVGQYTELTVPSGKIFEHDIVTAKFKSNGARFNFMVKYSGENGCYVFDNGIVKVPRDHIRSVRIIGNIHDNPELLKEREG